MSREKIKAGEAFVAVGVRDKLKAGLRDAQRKIAAFGASIRKVGTVVASVGGAMVAPLGLAIKAASDMQETMSKFTTVFGDQATAVKNWSDEFAGAADRVIHGRKPGSVRSAGVRR